MVGDIVRCDKVNGGEPTRIDSLFMYNDVVAGGELLTCDDLSPVPMSADFLLMSGFVEGDDGTFARNDERTDRMVRVSCDDGNWSVEALAISDGTLIAFLRFAWVHEIQHVLRTIGATFGIRTSPSPDK